MGSMLTGLVVGAFAVLAPIWAPDGNQEFAEQIAKVILASGQMHDYKIGVKCQKGTVWLQGEVFSEEQAKTAVDIVSGIPGVERVENGLTIVPIEVTPAQFAQLDSKAGASQDQDSPSTPQVATVQPRDVPASEQVSHPNADATNDGRVWTLRERRVSARRWMLARRGGP